MEKENQMVYCRLLSKNKNLITYSIGALYNDISGIIKLDIKNMSYEIVKQPQKEEVYEHFIDKMLVKYHPIFDKGEIPEKMSYEI